ncbi:hypothetical protein [Streptomyces sp. NPDC004726]
MMTHELDALRELLRRETAQIRGLIARRDGHMRQARALGALARELAEDTGLTPGRVSQIAPRPKDTKKGARKAAPKPPPEPSETELRQPLADDQLPEPFRPGATRGLRTLVSDLVTDRYARKLTERATIFVDLVTGEWCSPAAQSGRIEWTHRTAAELLEQLPEAVQRVYLVGPYRPGAHPGHGEDTEADAVRLWFLRPVDGWDVDGEAGHYLADAATPVGRWRQGEGDRARKVEVHRASTWFGDDAYTVRQAARAWWTLRRIVAAAFRDGVLLSTPATTGRDLWRRTIGTTRSGEAQTYPVLSDEMRQLIQSTSGQGRREIVPGPDTIGAFYQYDMRFAYAALAWGLPVGTPTMWTRQRLDAMPDDDAAKLLKGRGRWLVTATVPGDWQRVGLLGAPAGDHAGDHAWCYPAAPGQRFTTWASGGEVDLARQYGWDLRIHEGMSWKEGKPLNVWRDKLTSAYQAAEGADGEHQGEPVSHLVRAALRNLVLMTIGAFAARSHMISRAVPADADGDRLIPSDRPVREVGGMYLWEEPGEVSEWVKRQAHPEWSAEIWARCRTRLLTAPTGTPAVKAGALHVPADTVIGMRTDALYLAADPGWADDGEPGRYRLKGRLDGERARPVDEAQLDALKSEATANV